MLGSLQGAPHDLSKSSTRPWPGAIDIDFGECSPQPFLALLPDPISLGFGIWTSHPV
jgi:hypothetical protein